ncbi:hypothetical protein HOY82DRAFT_196591 [Tuber indicum]|nr:hypothetical protein HOY82DRAFT_196591 [Tuber indicum]
MELASIIAFTGAETWARTKDAGSKIRFGCSTGWERPKEAMAFFVSALACLPRFFSVNPLYFMALLELPVSLLPSFIANVCFCFIPVQILLFYP